MRRRERGAAVTCGAPNPVWAAVPWSSSPGLGVREDGDAPALLLTARSAGWAPGMRGRSIFTFGIRWTSVCSPAETWPQRRGSWARGNCGLNATERGGQGGESTHTEFQPQHEGIDLSLGVTFVGTDVDCIPCTSQLCSLPASHGPQTPGCCVPRVLPRQHTWGEGFLRYKAKQKQPRHPPVCFWDRMRPRGPDTQPCTSPCPTPPVTGARRVPALGWDL